MKLASAIYARPYPFLETGLFTHYNVVNTPDELTKDCDALVVWGGEDISPALYNHRKAPQTGAGTHPSRRDQVEWDLMNSAVEKGIPIIGICRGGQMLCALAGGSLYQHVNGHTGGNHATNTDDGLSLPVSSLHHQMMNPAGTEHKLIMWSQNHRSNVYIGEGGSVENAPEVEPEYIYFPKIKGHAIQWHPEFMDVDDPANIWLFDRWKKEGLQW